MQMRVGIPRNDRVDITFDPARCVTTCPAVSHVLHDDNRRPEPDDHRVAGPLPSTPAEGSQDPMTDLEANDRRSPSGARRLRVERSHP